MFFIFLPSVLTFSQTTLFSDVTPGLRLTIKTQVGCHTVNIELKKKDLTLSSHCRHGGQSTYDILGVPRRRHPCATCSLTSQTDSLIKVLSINNVLPPYSRLPLRKNRNRNSSLGLCRNTHLCQGERFPLFPLNYVTKKFYSNIVR